MPKALPSDPFQPSGVITLTTDFGRRDPFVGVMKGQVLRRLPQARLVDLTHEIEAHCPAEAGFWLGRCYAYFPAGHGARRRRRPGRRQHPGHRRRRGRWAPVPGPGQRPAGGGAGTPARSTPVLRQLDLTRLPLPGLGEPASATFHGRDIFAPVAAELAAGRLAPADLGPVVPRSVPGARRSRSGPRRARSGAVVTVDHFGNLLTNLDAALVAAGPVADDPGGRARAAAGRRTYADLRAGRLRGAGQLVRGPGSRRGRPERGRGLGLGRGAVVTIESKVAG